MTVKTYEMIGNLIGNIKRSKSIINHQTESINKDFEKLNELLKENDQPKIELEDIKCSNRYEKWEDEF